MRYVLHIGAAVLLTVMYRKEVQLLRRFSIAMAAIGVYFIFFLRLLLVNVFPDPRFSLSLPLAVCFEMESTFPRETCVLSIEQCR